MNNVYQACLLNKVKEHKLQLELVNCLMGSIDPKKKTGECMAKFKGISELNKIILFPLLHVIIKAIIFWSLM